MNMGSVTIKDSNQEINTEAAENTKNIKGFQSENAAV